MDDMIGAEVVEKVKMEDLVQEYLTSKEKVPKQLTINFAKFSPTPKQSRVLNFYSKL